MQIDLKFDNISKIQFTTLPGNKHRMMIVLKKPTKIFERIETRYNEVPSPCMFQKLDFSQMKEQRDFPIVIPDEEKVFLNSWNYKQVILLEGDLDISI